MPDVVDQHHHRKTTVSLQKAFKPRFTSKNELKNRAKGRVERQPAQGTRKTPHQMVMSKFDRRNQAKQRRLTKKNEHAKAVSVFSGKDGAPRVVAVVPLTSDIDVDAAVKSLNASLDIVQEEGVAWTSIERFKQKISYLHVKRELFEAMDACRIADYVLFVLSAKEEVDEMGETIIRSVEGQGVSHTYTAVQALEAIEPPKKRPQVMSSLQSFISHFFPAQDRLFSLDSRQECQNLLRSICTTLPRGVRWREDRSWMLVESLTWDSETSKAPTNGHGPGQEVVLTGVVRGKNFKADRLVRVGDWGEFQVSKVTSAPLVQRSAKRQKSEAMTVDEESMVKLLDEPSADHDTLEVLAPEEAVMEDLNDIAASIATTDKQGVLLDDERYYSDSREEGEDNIGTTRVPRGTSKYQSAWYLANDSDSGSDLESILELPDEDGEADPNDMDIIMDEAGPSNQQIQPETIGGTEYPESEPFNDPETNEADLLAYRAGRQNSATDAENDLLFPDEIELHPHVLARERLARYRGLRSLRTSTWNTDEDRPYEPVDWPRLLDISDYKAAKSKVLREALIEGVKPGTRVNVHLRNVPPSIQQFHDPTKPLALYSLLRHEHKHTAVNYSITLSSECEAPIKSKEELLVQCGPRRMLVNPLFSQGGNTPNNVHKFERYLHPGRSAVASFTGPLTWGAVPVLFFKRTQSGVDDMVVEQPTMEPGWTLVGTGTSLPASTSRVIAKRAVLTGQPYKINRRVVTVRYMFFNPEDVAWFKALRLWTNRAKQGSIKESLGTHGYFKAMFDAKIGMQDAIGMSLYKRMWPRPARVLNINEATEVTE